MFALFEDDVWSAKEPQASLPSAAQPAFKDIRRLRRRLLEIYAHNVQAKIQNAKKELSLLSLLSLKQPQAKISIVVKNNRKQETDILSLKTKKASSKRAYKPSVVVSPLWGRKL